MPALFIGRLAISQDLHGKGLGQMLLMDALYRSLEVSGKLGAAGVVVDAKDETAAAFYEQHGFIRFQDSHGRFYLPMGTIETMFA